MSILSDLTLDDLRYLVAVADHGGVQAAATALGVSQPTVSKRLNSWRDRRPPLLRKEAGRDVLTERGQQVVASAREILRQIDQLSRFIRQQEDVPNSLLLAAGSVASQWYLAPAISLVMGEFPDWKFRTRVMRGAKRIEALADGEIDLAVVSHDVRQVEMIAGDRVLNIEPLVEQCLCIVAHKETAWAGQLSQVLKGQQVPLSLLASLELVGPDSHSGLRRLWERRMRRSGAELRFVAETGGWAGAKEYARCGLGAAILPLAYLSKDDLTELVARRLEAGVAIQHSLLRRESEDRCVVHRVSESIQTVAREHAEQAEHYWQGSL